MEYWMNKAFDINPKRAEPIYFLVNYFRIVSQHHKAYHYYLKGKDIPYPENELLFIEHTVYSGMFQYENTILSCYLCRTRQDGLSDIVSYINKYPFHLDNVWDNLHYYVEGLNGKYTKYNFPQFEEYVASSCSIINYKGSNILNIRLVNYSIDERSIPIRHIYHIPIEEVSRDVLSSVLMYIAEAYRYDAKNNIMGITRSLHSLVQKREGLEGEGTIAKDSKNQKLIDADAKRIGILRHKRQEKESLASSLLTSFMQMQIFDELNKPFYLYS
jgi:hypothetical protein